MATTNAFLNHTYDAISDIVSFFLPSVGQTMKRKRDESLESQDPKIVASNIRYYLDKAYNAASKEGSLALNRLNAKLAALPIASSPMMMKVIADAKSKINQAINKVERATSDYETENRHLSDRADSFNQLDTQVKARRANQVDNLHNDADEYARNYSNKIKEIEKYV